MNISITTNVTNEPLSIDVIKRHVQYEGDDVDYINELVRMSEAARELCENYTDHALGVKTINVYFEADYDMDLDSRVLLMPISPVNSVTSVFSVDSHGTETVLVLNTSYYLRGITRKELYIPESWSTGTGTTIIGWHVVAIVGYTPETIPAIFKECILKLVADWYNVKGNYVPQLTDQVKTMLATWGDRSW